MWILKHLDQHIIRHPKLEICSILWLLLDSGYIRLNSILPSCPGQLCPRTHGFSPSSGEKKHYQTLSILLWSYCIELLAASLSSIRALQLYCPIVIQWSNPKQLSFDMWLGLVNWTHPKVILLRTRLKVTNKDSPGPHTNSGESNILKFLILEPRGIHQIYLISSNNIWGGGADPKRLHKADWQPWLGHLVRLRQGQRGK